MKIGIIRYPGSNCDFDTLRYFKNSIFIWHKETVLPDIDLLIIPGGFAFGDRYYEKATEKYVISPGQMALESPVTKVIHEAVAKNILILGICNGFQILTKLNLLPGKLRQNNSKKFECREIKCSLNFSPDEKYEQELYIANSYGRYELDKNIAEELRYNEQIFLTYKNYNNGSIDNIGGVCNKERTIFGIMPHPERNPDVFFKERFYSFFYNIYFKRKIDVLMASEHISYKSTKKYLSTMFTEAPWVIQGPGENAGIVDIGNGYCIALRIESHNHPIFIDPYEGAATGVGGILRDIFTMGARPIAILDFLRFGNDEKSNDLIDETIRGISAYGNCIGVPNVGGDFYRDDIYNKNPLLNVACLGIVKKDKIIYGNVKQEGDLLIYVGSKTGDEGIGGAAMASQEFKGDTTKLQHNIQKSDPFLEKLLLEACCEITELELAVGMQDMGAGGLLCASMEVVSRGAKKTGKSLGCIINLEKVPIKYKMDFCNILISESQERMLIVCKESNKSKIFDIFKRWDLEYAMVGIVNNTGMYEVRHNDELLYKELLNKYEGIRESWEEIDFPEQTKSTLIKDMEKWKIYDSTIGCRTIKGPHQLGSYAILDIFEIGKNIILTWGETFQECYAPMITLSGKPLCLINCLNFGHPKDSMGAFAETVRQLNIMCKKYQVPVVGGNVSLYNSTDNSSIKPTPIFVMMGLITEKN